MRGQFTPRHAKRDRMVRTASARAHPSLHHRAACAAKSNRSSRAIHALPVRLAARQRRAARVSGPEALAGVLAQLEGFEAPAARGKPRCCRRASAITRSPGSTTCAPPAASCGRACAPRRSDARRPQRVRARHADRAAAAPHTGALDAAGAARRERRCAALSFARRAASPISCASTAHRSSTNSSHGAHLLQTELEDALRRTGGARPRALRQLRRLARAAGAGIEARLGALPDAARIALFGIEDAGRWALDASGADIDTAEAQEITRGASNTSRGPCCAGTAWCAGACSNAKPPGLPPWRELCAYYHRLEARGEIRGGRFIAGLSGEQFALPEALGLLRQVRRRSADGQLVRVSATDPANLLGSVLVGAKIPRCAWIERALPGRCCDRDQHQRAGAMAGHAGCAGATSRQRDVEAAGGHEPVIRGAQSRP